MDRYPVIVYLGVGILGKVGAEMMMTDPFIACTMHPSQSLTWLAEGLAIVVIFSAGKLLRKK